MKSGDLCVVSFPFCANYCTSEGSLSYDLYPGECFVLLEWLEIEELGAVEIQILFENKKMWLNIHENGCNIDNVRRAGSYDIPFMTLQELEPGSNSLFDQHITSPHPPRYID